MSFAGMIPTTVSDTMGFSPSRLEGRTDEDRAKDAQKYLQFLADYRLPWEPMIDNLIMYCNPQRRGILDKYLWPGLPAGMEIYDDTAILAKNMLVDGMVGYLCGRNQPWFALEIPGNLNFPRSSGMRAWSGKKVSDYPAVQKWLQDCQDVLYSDFNRSNFYDVVTQFIADGSVCGTAYFLIEEDVATATNVCTVPHFRECYIAENRFGDVDTTYRVYPMTLRQFVQQFGLEKMEQADPAFKRDYESNMHAQKEVLHAIYPRADYDPSRIDAKGKKYESIWVYNKGGRLISGTVGPGEVTMLRESGYDTKPMMAWRWWSNSDEIYGRGPAHDAWIAVATANQMGRTNLITAQKAAEPPLVAYEDQRGKIMRGPNAMSFIPSNRGSLRDMMPLPLTSGVQQLPFTTEYQQRVGQLIMQHFHADTFTLMTQVMQEHGAGRPVTEQIYELMNEKAAVLGTRVGKLQSEAFNPIIERFYDIAARAGRIPTPPDILLSGNHYGIAVEYLGMLAQAQTRLTDVRIMQSGLSFLTQSAQIDPVSVQVADMDKFNRRGLLKIGFPQEVMRTQEELTRIRVAAQQQQEKQQQIENAPKIAKAAALAGKGAEPQSPLRALMSGGQDQ